ncbi:hypothetical protein [Paraburkholderia caribensis]|uniref:hypothetical protein n=1 Tax=Paraburkholderia caribensis TaxID=75105 RepID=UPI0011DF912E|nr:hypothetical protein [Paraburkholderia caribensis]
MTRCVALPGCVLLCATWGCTIAGQYKDIHATDERIAVKTAEVQQADAEQAQLQAQMKQLSDELADKKLTSAQLDARLAALQKQNQQLAADNAKKRAQRDALARELADYRAQVAAIKASKPATGTSSEAALAAQQRQLDELKQRIHTRLLALAQGG